MNFHEVRFPAKLSAGSSGGPESRTQIVALASGHEERNAPWSQSRRRYDAGLAVQSLDELSEIIAFFEARRGRLYGFRWKDWTDFKSCRPSARPAPTDQVIGTGDGRERVFQLSKTYRSGVHQHRRVIAKPVVNSVLIAIGGDQRISGRDFTVDHTTGLVRFAVAPPEGAPVTAGFEFDVPVRFDTDRIEASQTSLSAGEVPSIPIVEVRV